MRVKKLYLLNVKPYSEGIYCYEKIYHSCPLPASTQHRTTLPASLVPVVVIAHTLHPHHGPLLLDTYVLLVDNATTASHPTHTEQLQQGWQKHYCLLRFYLSILATGLK